MNSVSPKTTPSLNHQAVSEPPRPAASVILLRDHGAGIEAFLLERPQAASVMAGVWVFPGGKVDLEDHKARPDEDKALTKQKAEHLRARLAHEIVDPVRTAAFMRAAQRETEEECAVRVPINAIEGWSRWITPRVPSMSTKRFDTFFFLAALPEGEVARHDGEESVQGLWTTPIEALDRYWKQEIMLAPPQIMTLVELSQFSRVDDALEHARARLLPHIQPEPLEAQDGGRIVAYPGDEAHSISQALIKSRTTKVLFDWIDPPVRRKFEQVFQ
ncbi:MAG: NUDIX domain-containing protein [Betaproteobacteria bacterium]|nr:NUDIX domain-containing protein [Betaproteobacteria bacterium]